MHKLISYICDELEDIERKATKDGKLSMQELQYADTLAHLKKNLLKADEMSEGEYSMARGYSRRGSYADGEYSGESYVRPDGSYRDGGSSYRGRGARRDAMGRYSSAENEMIYELEKLMEKAPDERTKGEIRKLMEKM